MNPIATLIERFKGHSLRIEDLLAAISQAFDHARTTRQSIPSLTVSLHPQDYEMMCKAYPFIERQLSAHAAELTREFGLPRSERPGVLLTADEQAIRGEVHVEVMFADRTTGQRTDKLDITPDAIEKPPHDAALIIEGRAPLPLTRYALNIGRQADNHLVLDDSRISRQHCQLRLRNGHYVVYDLGSTHGIFVNGVRVTEHTLLNGDILTVGNISLIYVQDDGTDHYAPEDTSIKPPL